MRDILAAFARNSVFANILLFFFMVLGLIAALNMVRETFPEFSLDYIQIRVPWPGADPEDVEEGICRKIEEAIEAIEGIKTYTSTSGENFGSVLIEVEQGYDTAVVKEKVRNEVEAISSFPEDAERPITEEVTLRREVMMVALAGEELDERQLKEWAEEVKESLQLLPEISQVQVMGARDYEIGIEISEERLREYGLTFAQVSQAVRQSSLNLTGGTVRTVGEDIRLRTIGRKYTGKELAEIVVMAKPDGDVITLDRIAKIDDGFSEDKLVSRMNGAPAITVAVLKTQEEDALAISTAVREWVSDQEAVLPEGLSLRIWNDTSVMLQARIDLLLENGLIGLILVFVILWLFLDLRMSFWAGMGIPISIAGALGIMWAYGATINMVSLFGLIMVLGIIVDDAIVVGESIYVARLNGAGPLEAAIEGTREVAMPVIAAVTTTIVAFIPLGFIGGIMGKFIAIVPVVVIACLVVSLVESLILLPAHLNSLPDPNEQRKLGKGRALAFRMHHFTNDCLVWVAEHPYASFLQVALRWRYVSLAASISILLLAIGIWAGGILKFEMFPKVDSDILTATVEFPDGTPMSVTQAAVKQLESALERIAVREKTLTGEPLIKNTFSLIGSVIQEGPPKNGNNVASIRVEMLDSPSRGIFYETIADDWEKEVGSLPGVLSLLIVGMENGPPGAAIEIWLQGHDMDLLNAAAGDLKAELATFDGVYQIQDDYRPGKNELKFTLKPEARVLGLTVSDLARQVYAGYFGEEAFRMQRGRDDIRVRVRYTTEERKQIAELEQRRIRTPQGYEVPLHSVAYIEYGAGLSDIKRTDGMRRVAVTAEVNTNKANTETIVSAMEKEFFKGLQAKYTGLYVDFQGEKKKSQESFASLKISFPLALIGIYVIIATAFRSYLQPIVVMITVPFGIIGAFLGHLALGFELSMMSLFGIVALAGVVVNDAIVLVECVNMLVAAGMPFREAIWRGGVRRFRAIFLTTATTVGGLAPLILEPDVQAQFLVPMAVSLAAGVAFATLLTLILLPCLLLVLNDLRRASHWIWYRRWPSREEVEPWVGEAASLASAQSHAVSAQPLSVVSP
jgi:multidrug efflux pump subunit AcrB